MQQNESRNGAQTRAMKGASRRRRLLRFLIGVLLIGGLALLLGSGLTPPGAAGAVIRNNHEQQIHATALFYGDSDDMPQIERDLAKTRAEAAKAAKARGGTKEVPAIGKRSVGFLPR